MTTTCFIVAKLQNTNDLIVRDASPHDLVRAVFEQIWIIPKEISYFDQKFTLVLSAPIRRKFAGHQVIDDVSVPRQLSDREEMFIRKVISDSREISRAIKFQSGQVICNDILNTFLVLDSQVKFLQQKDPSN